MGCSHDHRSDWERYISRRQAHISCRIDSDIPFPHSARYIFPITSNSHSAGRYYMHPLAQQDPTQEASITFNTQPGDLYGIQRQHRDSHSISRGDLQPTEQVFKAESESNITGISRVRDRIPIVVRDWIPIVVRDWIPIMVRDWIPIMTRDHISKKYPPTPLACNKGGITQLAYKGQPQPHLRAKGYITPLACKGV